MTPSLRSRGRTFQSVPPTAASSSLPFPPIVRKPTQNQEKRPSRGERQDWAAADARSGGGGAPRPAAAADGFRAAQGADRQRGPQHDIYQNVETDPYDAGGARDFDANWQAEDFEQAAGQFKAPNFYQPHEEPNPAEAQSVHDRFFVADPEPERAPAAASSSNRYRSNEFSAEDFDAGDRDTRRGTGGNGFAQGGDHPWDGFDQAPAPELARPFPNAKLGSREEFDADYLAEDDDFDGDDDYAEAKKGGSKKLMAAVLVGAIVTGGGLAYLYKSQMGGGEGGEPPIMTADTRPIKEKPQDPGGREFPNGSKLIYDRLDSGAAAGSDEEQTRVAARDEQPQNNNDVPGVITTGASGTLEERIQNALRDAKKPDDGSAAAGNANPNSPRPGEDGDLPPGRLAGQFPRPAPGGSG